MRARSFPFQTRERAKVYYFLGDTLAPESKTSGNPAVCTYGRGLVWIVIPGSAFDKNDTAAFPSVPHRRPVAMHRADAGDKPFANIKKNDTPRAIYGRNCCSRRGETGGIIAETDPANHSYNVVFGDPVGGSTRDDLRKRGTRLND